MKSHLLMSVSSTALVSLALGSLGCDSGTVDPSVLRGDVRIQVLLGPDDGFESLPVRTDASQGIEDEASPVTFARTVNAFALIQAQEGEELPDTPESGVSLTLDGGVGRHFVTDGEEPAGVWKIDRHPAPLAADYAGPFEVTLRLPGAEPIVRSIPMVHAADFTSPAAGAELRVGEDVELSWSSATVDEADYAAISFPGYGWVAAVPIETETRETPDYVPDFGVRAADGVPSVIFPAKSLVAAYEELVGSWEAADAGISGGDAVHADLRLFRARHTSNEPDFAEGITHVVVEVARVRVVVRP